MMSVAAWGRSFACGGLSTRLVLLTATSAILACGQPRAQISGFVRDASDAVIRDAAISVLNLDTGIRRATRSNSEGFYAVSSLTPGAYRLTVRKPGFQTFARSGIQLHALDAERLDFSLTIGGLRDEITVEATPPLTNNTGASTGIQVGRRPAEQLPVNGRGLQALIDLAPGVLITPATGGEAGQFSANGQRPATNYFTVDGVSANNGVSGAGLPGQFSGASLPTMSAIGSLHNLISLAELDELRVQTSTYAPEYGRLPGAQVAVSTRSGSNEWHGESFLSIRHENASALDPFAKAARLARTAQRMTDGGASLGGPLRRNQTFFFLSTEHIGLRQPATFLSAVPSITARQLASPESRRILDAFPLPNGRLLDGGLAAVHTARSVNPASVHATSARADQALGAIGSLFFRFNRTPSSTTSGYLQRNRAHFNSQTFTAGVVAVLGSRTTNDARAGVSHTSVKSTWLAGVSGLDVASLLPPPGEGQRLWGIGIRGLGQILSGDPGESRQGLWTLSDAVAVTSGKHEIRFGLDYQRLTPNRDRSIASVTALYDSLDAAVSGLPPALTFAQTGGGSSLIETGSLFAQDTWHVTPRLNITYGLRWELTPPPSYRSPAQVPEQSFVTSVPPAVPPVAVPSPELLTGTAPVWQSRRTQFAPRMGVAYRVSDALVVRAGGGLFYDLGFSSAVDLVNGAPFNRWRNTLTGPNVAFAPDIQYGFARDLRLPYTLQWNVSIERALGTESAVSAAYVGSVGRRLLRREGYSSPGEALPVQILATNNGRSSYHSLQLIYRTRNYRGVQGTLSYTWAHAIDNGSWDSASYVVFPGAGSDQDRGSANFDVRHSFQAALAYNLGRWTFSGTFRARTGFPIDVISAEQPFGVGFDNDVRPDLIPEVPLWLENATTPGGRRLNPAAFRQPAAGGQGTLGRNAIYGNGLAQLDFALQRDFAMGERSRLQFRIECYNVSNTTNFADPVRFLSSALFGYSPSLAGLMLGAGRPNSGLTPAFQSGGPRLLQAGLTLRF